MEHKYANFMNQIPHKNLQDTETHFARDLALFKPNSYIMDKEIQSVDYHIVLLPPSSPDVYINGKQHQIQRGKMITVNPGESVLCENVPQTKPRPFISLLIKPSLIQEVAREMGFLGDIRFLKLQNPFSSQLMQAIINFDQETKHPNSFALMLDCLGTQIVALLLREFETNFKKYPAVSRDINDCVNLALEYMETFFSANITIQDICDEIHVSPFHFIRSFKQKIGVSPHQYLLKVRIKKAEELLRVRRHSVAETAKLCGFVSVPHFSNTFRIITGHSPSDYKRTFF